MEWIDKWIVRWLAFLFVIICTVAFVETAGASVLRVQPKYSLPTGDTTYYPNSDGTYTEWLKARTGWVQGDTYSAKGMEAAYRMMQGAEADAGSTSQTASIVQGINGQEINGSEDIYRALSTGKPYTTIGEADVGDALMTDMASEGLSYGLTTIAGSVAGGVVAGAGVFAVGVAIGTGVDSLVGLPSLLEQGESVGAKYEWKWLTHEYAGHEIKCEKLGLVEAKQVFAPPGETCIRMGQDVEVRRIGTESWTKYNLVGSNSTSGIPEYECPGSFDGTCHEHFEEYHVGCCNFTEYNSELWVTRTEFQWDGFMHKGAFSGTNQVKAPEGELTPLEKVATPLAPKPVKQGELPNIPPAVVHVVIEKGKDERGRKIVEPMPEEEGTEIPSPLFPEIPEIKPNEVYTEYKTALEAAGFTTIHENVLPETNPNPRFGPNAVTSVAPSPGTRADPKTEVNVDVNPEKAPSPEPRTPIGPPTLPGIKLPNPHLLCTTFPFGVPCWLVHQMEKFVATSKAPVWKIGPFHWAEITIPAAEVNLEKLEPIMVIVRPIMLLFGTIGITLFWYGVFTGKKLGGGENPKGVSAGYMDDYESGVDH